MILEVSNPSHVAAATARRTVAKTKAESAAVAATNKTITTPRRPFAVSPVASITTVVVRMTMGTAFRAGAATMILEAL